MKQQKLNPNGRYRRMFRSRLMSTNRELSVLHSTNGSANPYPRQLKYADGCRIFTTIDVLSVLRCVDMLYFLVFDIIGYPATWCVVSQGPRIDCLLVLIPQYLILEVESNAMHGQGG